MVYTLMNPTDCAQQMHKNARTALSVASHNINNSHVEGASRQETHYLQRDGVGTVMTTPKRVGDEALDRQVRDQVSRCTYLGSQVAVGEDIKAFLGNLDQNSLSNRLMAFEGAVKDLSNTPDSIIKQQNLIQKGVDLANFFTDTSRKIQTLRARCDTGIFNAATEVNQLSTELFDLNALIKKSTIAGQPIGDLEDRRDRVARDLAGQLNITTYPSDNGTWRVTTAADHDLVNDTSYTLCHFDKSTVVDPTSTLNKLYLGTTDITRSLSGGRIGALLKDRDDHLPALQAEIDLLAQHVRDVVNQVHNKGGGFPGAQNLSGGRAIADPNAPFQGQGTIRVAILDPLTGHYVGGGDVDLSTCHTFEAVRTSIDAIGGVTAAWDPIKGSLNVTSDDPTKSIVIGNVGPDGIETTTGLGFSHYFGLNDFFQTDGSHAQDGGSIVGISGKMTVRSDLVMAPNRISRASLNTSTPIDPANIGLWSGAADVMAEMTNVFDWKENYDAAGMLPITLTSVKDYAKNIVETEAIREKNLGNKNTAEEMVLGTLTDQQSRVSGIDVTAEFAKILETSRMTQAASLIIQVSKNMMDDILKVI